MKPIYRFSDQLLLWFDSHGRKDLPWQQDRTAYRVWVSEIMLQQTQVSAVIGYYQKFMARFPNIEALADAPLDDVLAHWAGLGYYARARNLHKAAQIVTNELNGNFPAKLEEISGLPGIGRSTAGAILSIVHKNPHPILDGNVKRVLARLHDIEGWPGQSKIEKRLWELAESYTPTQRCDDYTQAIMDFGATLCTRAKPDCTNCPFEDVCKSRKNDTISQRPTSKPKKQKPVKELWLIDIRNDKHILLEKRPPSGIWGGLHSLIELEHAYLFEELEDVLSEKLNLKISSIERTGSFEHIFSHYKLVAQTVLIHGELENEVCDSSNLNWHIPHDLSSLGLPAPIKKYFTQSGLLP